ncbi:ASB_HP2_G0031790.mRNA.1.CDS.1 [Saccharomyces cerevisiae]|nr:ASB_HP2_G0031790.mRNA.1.CDS.1 [Saccharomyces cerevisiae]CAI6612571.1 ASB_HP2_G0031790.mRNA.1.CDS.1 [Saccharomyces cerevisiae]
MPLPLLAPTPALMPLPLKVPTLVPRRTPIKMAMLRIIDSIQSPTLTKSRISGKGESNGFVREKETESTISQYYREYECLTVSRISIWTKLNIFSSMVLTYTSAQREYSHNTDYARAVKRCSSSVSIIKGCRKVSYRRMAWEALAVERMLRNDE